MMRTREEQSHCSFCGQSRPDVRFLMQGPAVAICGDCIVEAVRKLATSGVAVTIEQYGFGGGPDDAKRPAMLSSGEMVIMGGGGAAPGLKPTVAKGGPK
jgi:hypothetical protein